MSVRTEALALKPVQLEPYNAESPLAALTEVPTPTELFYIRSNFAIPRLDKATWTLRVSGAVSNPREFTFDELMSFARADALVLLECAGNGRSRMVPVPSGVAWDVGAVSTAHFGGVRLADVLRACGVRDDAFEVVFRGADAGEVEPGRVVAFERSLPIDMALEPSVLLADEMNGAALTAEHGFPLRVLVPRWYAVASVKWLLEIRVSDAPFTGHFQTERYVYVQDPIVPDETPVREMRVRALIAAPADGAALESGLHRIQGIAWSGAGAIASVEVSTDGGTSWRGAALGAPASTTAPTPWSIDWQAGAGRHTVIARATDAAGNTQPLTPISNKLGYGNNIAHALTVEVA